MSFPHFVDFAIAFGTSTLMGYFLTSLLLHTQFSSVLKWTLAIPTGIGLCSLIDFLFRRPMFTVEAIVGILLFALWLWRRGGPITRVAELTDYRAPIVVVLFVCALAWALSTAYSRVVVTPLGGWDGWAIWNSHARFIYRDPKLWKTHLEHTFHPDYPLLVPFMVVRSWRFVGTDAPGISGLIGLLLTFSGIGVLAASLAERRSLVISVLIGLVLLATPNYLVQAALQEGDTPISVFIVSTIALLCLYFESAPQRLGVLALAGFMAGCAGWTKNEGLLFIVAISIALLVPVFTTRRLTFRRFTAFAAGLALPLAVIVIFKLTVAPQNDLMQNRRYEEVVGRVLDANRYIMISESFVQGFRKFGGWAQHPALALAVFLLFSGIDRKTLRSTGWLTGVLALLIVLGGYYCVYVFTPLDLRYHLDSSYHRLLMHLWPSILLLTGWMVFSRESEKPSAV